MDTDLFRRLILALSLLTLACQEEAPAPIPKAAVVTAIELTAAAATVPLGGRVKVTAKLLRSDDTSADATEDVTWTTSDPTRLAASNEKGTRGIVTGVSPGTAEVTAKLGEIASKPLAIAVDAAIPAALSVAPLTLAAGTTGLAHASATYSDGALVDVSSSVTWSLTPAERGTVSNELAHWGEVTASKAGTGTLTAKLGALEASATLTVTAASLRSIAVTPTRPSAPAGHTVQLTATGTFADGTTQDLTKSVVWSAPDGGLVISNESATAGVATPLRSGLFSAVATLDGVFGSTIVAGLEAVVESLVDLQPKRVRVGVGQTAPLALFALFSDSTRHEITTDADVTWAVDEPTRLALGASPGTIIGRAQGAATVTATLGSSSVSAAIDVVAPASLTVAAVLVSPVSSTLLTGQCFAFKASVTYSDGSTLDDVSATAQWKSSDPAILAPAGPGSPASFCGGVAGSATITATVGGVEGSAPVVVQRRAAPYVAPVASIIVGPANATLLTGGCTLFTAQITYEDGSKQNGVGVVAFSTSDAAVLAYASSQAENAFCGVTGGTAKVIAKLGNVTGSADVTVTQRNPPVVAQPASIRVTPAGVTLLTGECADFEVLIVYTDGTTRNGVGLAGLSSSNADVLTYASGVAATRFCGVAAGTANVVAKLGSVEGTVAVTVNARNPPPPPPAQLIQAITIGPGNVSIPENGYNAQFFATCQWSDGHVTDCTGIVTWVSSDETVLRFGGFCGVPCAAGIAPGTINLTAKLGTLTSNAIPVTVTSVLLPLGIAATWPTIVDALGGVAITGQGFSSRASDVSVKDAAGTPLIISAATPNGVSANFPANGVSGPLTVTVRGQTRTTDTVVIRYPNSRIASMAITPIPGDPTKPIDTRLYDGNLGNGWYIPYLDQSALYAWGSGMPISVVIDLGSSAAVGHVGFTIPDGAQCDGNVCSRQPTSASIHVSNDGTTWTQVGANSFSPWVQCSVRGLSVKATTSGAAGRYVKLVVNPNLPSGLGYTAALFEVGVSGT